MHKTIARVVVMLNPRQMIWRNFSEKSLLTNMTTLDCLEDVRFATSRRSRRRRRRRRKTKSPDRASMWETWRRVSTCRCREGSGTSVFCFPTLRRRGCSRPLRGTRFSLSSSRSCLCINGIRFQGNIFPPYPFILDKRFSGFIGFGRSNRLAFWSIRICR